MGLEVLLPHGKGHPPLGPGGGARGEGVLAHEEDPVPPLLRGQGGVDPRHPGAQDEEVCATALHHPTATMASRARRALPATSSGTRTTWRISFKER